MFFRVALLILLCDVSTTAGTGSINVALGKQAYQSSTAHNGYPNRALDGNKDSHYPHGSCTHTDAMPGNWWLVDLNETYTIDRVALTNRADNAGHRLADFYIRVGQNFDPRNQASFDPGNYTICQHVMASMGQGVTRMFQCSSPIQGRYVTVHFPQTKTEVITLCEVEVLEAAPAGTGSMNLALNKQAYQSSTTHNGFANRAVDGNSNTNYNSGLSCTATNNLAAGSWWLVDLGDTYTINRVALTNRGDDSNVGHRLSNFFIRIGRTFDPQNQQSFDPRTYTLCQHVMAAMGEGETRMFYCTSPIEGRYVTVHFPQTRTEVLTLCEVQVFDVTMNASDASVLSFKNETSHALNSCKVGKQSRIPCTQHPNVTESYCLSLGCCWDSAYYVAPVNVTNCFRRGVAVSTFKPNAFVADQSFCAASEGTFLLGDVNGDGITDQLCKANETVLITVGSSYSGQNRVNLQGCSGNNESVRTGDVNGDRRSDIVCLTETGGVMVWISKDGNPIFYDAEPWKDEVFGFCVGDIQSLHVSDFNGDGLADLLCAPQAADGKRSLALGEKSGTFRAPVTDANFQGFCTGTGQQLKVGDFDADGRSDLVCRVDGGNKYQIALTDGDGLLVNEDFKTEDGWCDKTNDTFLVGDFNGDHHDDWVCHHGDGSVCTKYNSHIFAESNMFGLKSCDQIEITTGGGNLKRRSIDSTSPQFKIGVGDFNGDGMDDLYLHDDSGNTSVAIATVKPPSVDFLQVDWDSDVAWNNDKFCRDKELYIGDVNGDNKLDVVCHENKGGLMQRILGNSYGQLIYSDKWTSFQDTNNVGRFCYRTHQNPDLPKRLKGDVNGDGRMDILCHSRLTGDVDVSHSGQQGEFGAGSSLKASFCQGQGVELTAADFDGDGKVDLMCRKPSTRANIWLQKSGDTVSVDASWCNDLFDEILVGQFGETRGQSLICHNRKTGAKSTWPVATGGAQTEAVNGNEDWCLSADKKQLKAGDFNGDKLTDLLCHQENGTMEVLLNQGEHKPHRGWFAEKFTASVKFCSEPGSALSVFDANGDGYDDLTCHRSTGRITISQSHLVASR